MQANMNCRREVTIKMLPMVLIATNTHCTTFCGHTKENDLLLGIQIERETDSKKDRPKGRQKDRKKEGEKDRSTERYTERKAERKNEKGRLTHTERKKKK